jgi:signal transduction histidine kinase
LKAFNENASHEMQTPLAVIRSKTELLLQQTEWNEEAVKQVLGIEDGIRKLTRLHQSLLLLTKIEHTKFEFNEPVTISTLIQQKLEEKQELFQSRNITLETNIQPFTIQFHPHLAEILINNLLSNAIKYTPVNGYMHISADADNIVFRNTAANGKLDAGKIFQRFYKAEQNQEGIGLGLSIVHEICRIGGFRIEYSFEKDQHIFTIYFKNNP